MNDLQSKFAITLVAFAFFFEFAFSMMKQEQQNLDAVVSHVGQVYISPTSHDPNAPSGKVSIDDLRKYEDKKAAAERKAKGIR